MRIPLKTVLRHMPASHALVELVAAKAATLDERFDLTRIEVAVDAPEGHARHGGKVHVRLDASIPGLDIVIHEAEEDAYTAVRMAFEAARRRLARARSRRGTIRRTARTAASVRRR